LGNQWAGIKYAYFMVFDKKAKAGAFNADKALELIKHL